MEKIFLSGSKNLNHIPVNLECVIKNLVNNKDCEFLIGDCCGADSLLQKLLYDLEYNDVTVYASGSIPRNFYGTIKWKKVLLGYQMMDNQRVYYGLKDIRMSRDCDRGIVLWDGFSQATKNNIDRLRGMGKKVTVFKEM